MRAVALLARSQIGRLSVQQDDGSVEAMGNDHQTRDSVPASSHQASMTFLWSAPSARTHEHSRVFVPRWRYEAFQRWFAPAADRDGVNTFVGRPWRAPGS